MKLIKSEKTNPGEITLEFSVDKEAFRKAISDSYRKNAIALIPVDTLVKMGADAEKLNEVIFNKPLTTYSIVDIFYR